MSGERLAEDQLEVCNRPGEGGGTGGGGGEGRLRFSTWKILPNPLLALFFPLFDKALLEECGSIASIQENRSRTGTIRPGTGLSSRPGPSGPEPVSAADWDHQVRNWSQQQTGTIRPGTGLNSRPGPSGPVLLSGSENRPTEDGRRKKNKEKRAELTQPERLQASA